MALPRLPTLRRYVATVSVAGLVVLAATVARDAAGLVDRVSALSVLLAALVVLGELVPVRVRRRDEEEEVTVSTTFAFALLLTEGSLAAMLALAAASVIADGVARKPAWKAAFNGAQACLAVAAAAAVGSLVPGGDLRVARVEAAELPGLLAAAVVFFVISNVGTGVAVALAEGVPVRRFLIRDLGFQAGATGILLSLAPIVVAAADDTLWLIPLLLLPIGAVHKAASVLIAKDHEAAHDPLTGMPNRTLFRERATDALEIAEETPRRVAVMLLDLDRFKEVNDTLGHHIGDLLLQQIGPRLENILRAEDTIARLGGDEFAVLLHEVPDTATAVQIAGRILAALEQPFPLPEVVLDVDASIGIALHPEHGSDIDILLQRADVAMYLAKETRSGFQVYSADRDPYSPVRLTLVQDMRVAMERAEFVLHYQPKANLESGRIVGVEALLRWQHPVHGLLMPDLFVPVAERSGLSRPLTLYVLDRGLRQLRQWHDEGMHLGLAVNLTLRNLHDPAFPTDVAALLARHEVDAHWLQMEITESIVMADPPRVLQVLSGLRDMGVELALDDFGTGYSSLAHLKRLPVHELKIDKSFVMNMCTDESDAVIVRSTIDLARNLGLRTVAEGVEDEFSWSRLRTLGCDVAQGYFLSRPVPAGELTDWLRAQGQDREAPLGGAPVALPLGG